MTKRLITYKLIREAIDQYPDDEGVFAFTITDINIIVQELFKKLIKELDENGRNYE